MKSYYCIPMPMHTIPSFFHHQNVSMIRNRTIATGGVFAALLGTFIAATEGLASLGCASTSAVIIVIAGAFGAGAGLASAVAGRRMEKQADAARPSNDSG